jgi:hypothetical protein
MPHWKAQYGQWVRVVVEVTFTASSSDDAECIVEQDAQAAFRRYFQRGATP